MLIMITNFLGCRYCSAGEVPLIFHEPWHANDTVAQNVIGLTANTSNPQGNMPAEQR